MSNRGTHTATIRDVAAEANVSISTVSLVLNGKGNVSEETRARVLQVATQLGYVPRQAARNLAARRSGNVGFVLRDDHFTRSEPFYTRIFLGTEFEARHQNLYVLLTTIPRHYHPGEHTPRFLRERNVDGILVAGKVDPAFLEEARGTGVPIVLIDFEWDDLPAFVINNQAGAREAVEHLIERGHRRIALLGADLDHPSLRDRLDGYRLALSAAGLPVDEHLLITDDADPTYSTGYRLAGRLLTLDPPPTAVFCVNDALALGVLDQARQRGIPVPERLAVLGFDDVERAAEAAPPLTTVRVFKEHLGELAMRHLHTLIEAPPEETSRFERGRHVVRVNTELVVRGST
ncbi:MAG: LacI family transcriptional regulator [Bacteroidetes bacterium]|nr:MAG: LacI family transcriptional regulator [Bacteroidota bacterium]